MPGQKLNEKGRKEGWPDITMIFGELFTKKLRSRRQRDATFPARSSVHMLNSSTIFGYRYEAIEETAHVLGNWDGVGRNRGAGLKGQHGACIKNHGEKRAGFTTSKSNASANRQSKVGSQRTTPVAVTKCMPPHWFPTAVEICYTSRPASRFYTLTRLGCTCAADAESR